MAYKGLILCSFLGLIYRCYASLMPDLSSWATDSKWAALSTGRYLSQPKCMDIPKNLSLCQNIGYDRMRLPNLLHHDTMREVTQQAGSWVPLLNLRCHPDTQRFLCSLFSPICLERPIWPCRSLCETVRNGCEIRMKKYGFPWPEMVRCDKFPLENDMCMKPLPEGERPDKRPGSGISHHDHGVKEDSMCDACKQPDTFEGIIDGFCNSNFALKMKVKKKESVTTGDMKMVALKKKKFFKKGSLSRKDIRKLTLYIENGGSCKCNRIEDTNDKTYYLIMGNKIGEKLVTSFVMKWDKKSRELRRATKSMKSGEICKGGIKALNDHAGPMGSTKPKPKGRKGKKKKRERRPRKGRKGKKNKSPPSEIN